MPLAVYDLNIDAGADWQRTVHLRDPGTGNLVSVSNAIMEIRNANFQLAMRLDADNGRCQVVNGTDIQLSIAGPDSRVAFGSGNFPGQYQAIGFWGIGRAYQYDIFANVMSGELGTAMRIMRGFVHVAPPITNPTEAQVSGPVAPSVTPTTNEDCPPVGLPGPVGPRGPAGPGISGPTTFTSGVGVPTAVGKEGDYYFRTDTPTVANQRLYACTGGSTWVSVA